MMDDVVGRALEMESYRVAGGLIRRIEDRMVKGGWT